MKTNRHLANPVRAIYTALNIPSVITYPSPSCLQWTPDGQVCFTTKYAVYLLTPDHGINFDTEAVVRSALTKDILPLGWYKTMIETSKIASTKWSEYSQSWAAMSLGSLDDAVVSVAISPTGLSPHGGCLVATLSANMDVVVWMAGKNYLKGEWIKVFEIIPFLLRKLGTDDDNKPSLASVLQAQVVSIEWTPQVDFGMVPTPWLDGSLLVLGTRAGYVTLLRYRNDFTIEYVQTQSVSKNWITRLAFDSWNIISPGHYEGNLAYAASDGSIGLIKIRQKLEQRNIFSFTPRHDIEVDMEHVSHLVYESENNAGVTSLTWVRIPGRSSILVSSNPGLLKLFCAPPSSSPTNWTGHRVLRLQTQKISRDSSALHPVSGVSYLPKFDALVVTLFDGSFHVVRNFSSVPEIVPSVTAASGPDECGGRLTSEALSRVSRTVFEHAEKGNVDKSMTNRIYASSSYDGDAVFLWAYESACPSDFSFKQDAQRSSTLIVAQMWDGHETEGFLQHLTLLLKSAKTSLGVSPLHILRPCFLHFQDPKLLHLWLVQFLEIICPALEEDYSNHIVIPPQGASDLSDELRDQFRFSLTTHLFGWDQLLRLRMRLSLADFAWKLSMNEESRAQCGSVAQIVLSTISHCICRTIIRHLLAVVGLLTRNELPFASRMVVQSMLNETAADISKEGAQLSTLLKSLVQSAGGTVPMLSAQPVSDPSAANREVSAAQENVQGIVGVLDEICPACGVVVPLEDVTSAKCNNGHFWQRCSVTTFILSTPWIRTCVGCCRKAFLPPSALDGDKGQQLPTIARGWVVEELLEAVKKCLFCGNGFVGIL